MKNVLVLAVMLVSGIALANPIDLTQKQLICASAVSEVPAALLTDAVGPNGETSFLYVEDSNQDGTYSEDEYNLFPGQYSTAANNAFLDSVVAQFTDGKAFDTIQEIHADLGDHSATFIYGFSVQEFGDIHFAMMIVTNTANNQVVFALPLACEEYVPN